MSDVLIFFAEGLEEIEGLTVVDMLRRADISIDIVSITGSLNVTGSHGITVKADKLFEDVSFKDVKMLVLPGGFPGTTNLKAHEKLGIKLKEFAAAGKYVAAICAAPTVLGALGILNGKQGTCYPGHEAELTGCMTRQEPVVVDGNIITSRGMGTAILFSAELISVLKDRAAAEDLLKKIVY